MTNDAPGLAGRPTALVTGATRGIGLEIARELARTHRVIVGGREQGAVEAVAESLPEAGVFIVDLADGAATEAAVRAAGIRSLDVLVHSAGLLGHHETVADATRESYRDVFELNVVAFADLARLLLPALRAARGTVVAINSGSGYRSGRNSAVYSASKFAMRAITDALREEERETGVRVTSVHPGRVATDMQQDLRRLEAGPYEPHRYLSARAVAEAVRYAVDAPEGASVEEIRVRPRG